VRWKSSPSTSENRPTNSTGSICASIKLTCYAKGSSSPEPSNYVSALRFFFVKTLKRSYLLDDIPYPKAPRRLPTILTVEEVGRVIDSARNLMDRTLRMVLYSTGMRSRELRGLEVKDIDSQSMLIHIQHGKGGRDRYVPLSTKLLETLRAYWRWMKPKTWLFPGTVDGWRADKPITPKVVWDACQSAAERAGIEKRVSAHLLRPAMPPTC